VFEGLSFVTLSYDLVLMSQKTGHKNGLDLDTSYILCCLMLLHSITFHYFSQLKFLGIELSLALVGIFKRKLTTVTAGHDLLLYSKERKSIPSWNQLSCLTLNKIGGRGRLLPSLIFF
jgi:hypothetical protein